MSKYYLKKKNNNTSKKWLRIFSLLLLFTGLSLIGYIFFPLILWQIYFAPVFAAQNISSPIPKTTIVNSSMIQRLIVDARNKISGVDYTNAKNWFPTFVPKNKGQKQITVPSYTLSLPSLKIENALVSTTDTDLAHHLVNYEGTAIPPQNGNTVIFGHSTLPQLFNPKDYKTIFATLYKINIGDSIYIVINNLSYQYKIQSIVVVDPTDTSVFSQNTDDSYLTLITCTPPGTIWKRLIVKARLVKI